MFLDSAQKYDSIVSHAKELNYVPRSTRSSAASVNISFETSGLAGRLTIPKGTRFTGVNSNGNFTFTTDEAKIYTSGGTTFDAIDLQIYEGDYFQDTYVVNYDIENQTFLLTNRNVDISSVSVNVIEHGGQTNTSFSRVETLFGLHDRSEVFFLQAAHNNRYEVVFGDGLFGRKPLNGAAVVINYRVATGPAADGIGSFVMADDIGPANGGVVDADIISVTSPSSDGAEQETGESVKFAAPRYFATQQRGIAADDYSALVLNNFGGEIADCVVYGGQEVEPKLYGRTIICIKPASGLIASNYIKNRITTFLQPYIGIPARAIVTDPEYTFCKISTTVQFDRTATSKTADEIKTSVLGAISNYNSLNLGKFGKDLRYSRLVSSIDSSDASIVSNDTTLRIIKRIDPIRNVKTSYLIDVGNVLYYDSTITDDNEFRAQLHERDEETRYAHSTLISSTFTYNALDGKQYPLSFFEDDARGNIVVFTTIGQEIVRLDNVGSIDYVTGKFNLAGINVADYSNHISIYLRSRFSDIFASQNKIIEIDPNDVSISVIETLR